MTRTPEGIVLSKCIALLKTLELQGKVKHWDRPNIGMTLNMQGYLQKQGRNGTSDLIAYVSMDSLMYVLFLEVKRQEGGIQSESQKEFENKFKGFDNVIYQIITDAKQIKIIVEDILSKSKDYGKIPDGLLPDNIG